MYQIMIVLQQNVPIINVLFSKLGVAVNNFS